MSRILVVLTGGTIASGRGEHGAAPCAEPAAALKNQIKQFLASRNAEAVWSAPFGEPGLDSSDFGPANWVTLTKHIYEHIADGVSGVLILHGTDTMAYTGAWLHICFGSSPVPIVLTGSQFTQDFTPEDGSVNLRGAAQVICSALPGVWLYFNWKLIPGNRAHKARATHPDAFVAINGTPLYFNPEWGLGECCPDSHSAINPQICENLMSAPEAKIAAERVEWLLCTPGCRPPMNKPKILGIMGFGSGNAPSALLERIETAYSNDHKPIILACSQAEGDMKNPAAYGGVGISRLRRAGFTVFCQADYPLEFMHALACYAVITAPHNPAEALAKYLAK